MNALASVQLFAMNLKWLFWHPWQCSIEETEPKPMWFAHIIQLAFRPIIILSTSSNEAYYKSFSSLSWSKCVLIQITEEFPTWQERVASTYLFIVDAKGLTGFHPMHSNCDAIWYKLSLLGLKTIETLFKKICMYSIFFTTSTLNIKNQQPLSHVKNVWMKNSLFDKGILGNSEWMCHMRRKKKEFTHTTGVIS